MSEINEHKDYSKPYWVAKFDDNSVIKYGRISEDSLLSTKMTIHTFSEKEDWIAFIEENGGEYVEQELTE
jgi:predicted DNA-binding WGR domain protein